MKISPHLLLKTRDDVKKSQCLRHLGFWCIFICYELFVVSFVKNRPFPVFSYVFSYALNIGLFYMHLRLMTDFEKRTAYRYGFLCGLVLSEILVYLAIKIAFDFFQDWNFTFLDDFWGYTVLHAWRGLYFMGFATLFWLFKRYHSIQRANYAVEKAKLLLTQEKTELELSLAKAKNAFLVQQMNPHLLFNGLNFIYNSNPSETPSSKCILLLSDMTRYALEISAYDQRVLLNEEINQVRNMIELNRLLLGEHMNLKVDIFEEDTSLKIIPLVLMTFTENLFKHANFRSKEAESSLRIALIDRKLHYHSLNLKKPRTDFSRSRERLGIRNAVQRLNYTYGKAYQLEINDNADTFEVNLILML